MNKLVEIRGQVGFSPEPTPAITKDRFGYTVYEHVFPDGKRYIGITSHPTEYRWRGGEGYSNMPKMKAAIDRYGWDNIEHRIVASGLSKNAAQQMEAILIAETDSVRNGYNASSNAKTIAVKREKKRKRVEANEKAILDTAKKVSRNPDRDMAILLLLLQHGLRPSDVIMLDVDDWDGWNELRVKSLQGDGRIVITDTLRTLISKIVNSWKRGKGNMTNQPLFISERGTRMALTTVLRIRRIAEAELEVAQ